MDVKTGTFVEIHSIVLNEDQRAPQVPKDTAMVPLEMWVKGFALKDCKVGDLVMIETMSGRKVEGRLVRVNPSHSIDYGKCVPELLYIGRQLRGLLEGGDRD